MKDPDLYSRILRLSGPGFVADVALDTAGGRVDVHVEYAAGVRCHCPESGRGRVRPISGFHVLVDALADKAPDRGDGAGLGEVEAAS